MYFFYCYCSHIKIAPSILWTSLNYTVLKQWIERFIIILHLHASTHSIFFFFTLFWNKKSCACDQICFMCYSQFSEPCPLFLKGSLRSVCPLSSGTGKKHYNKHKTKSFCTQRFFCENVSRRCNFVQSQIICFVVFWPNTIVSLLFLRTTPSQCISSKVGEISGWPMASWT